MGLKCFFRGHDWEEVGSVYEEFAISNLLQSTFRKCASRERNKRRAFLRRSIPPDCLTLKLTQYVCLRCCAVKDGVKDYLDRCKAIGYKEMEEEQRLIRRQEKANHLLKNCAKSKFRKVYNKEEEC